ncbi:carboxymuconolactone decarboxylase family protein [Anaerovoracaceae bacterium 42-11]
MAFWLTFTAIISIGGCEPQAKGHVAGNLSVGNTKELLIQAVTTCLPYIGYPRTLNALACIEEVCK